MKKALVLLLILITTGLITYALKPPFFIKLLRKNTKAEESAPFYPRALGFVGISKKGGQTPCELWEQEIVNNSLDDLLTQLQSGRISLIQDCKKDKFTAALLVKVNNNCTLQKIQANKATCSNDLFAYRSRLIQLFTGTKDLESLSTDLLLQIYYGLYLSAYFSTKEGSQKLIEVGQELKQRFRRDAHPYKIEILGYIVSPQGMLAKSSYVKSLIETARAEFPHDWVLFEMQLSAYEKIDVQNYARTIEEFYTSNPNHHAAQYFKGCLLWSRGDSTGALGLFKSAKDMAPTVGRYNTSYQYAQKSQPKSEICIYNLSLNKD